MGASLTLVFSQKTFEMFQPGVLDELETPAERRRFTGFNMASALTNATIIEEWEEELLLPDSILDCLPGVETIEEVDTLEREVARDLVYSLTPTQVDVVRRVVLEVEDMNTVARSYGVAVSEISLTVSCALDSMKPWQELSCINRVITLGRKLGF